MKRIVAELIQVARELMAARPDKTFLKGKSAVGLAKELKGQPLFKARGGSEFEEGTLGVLADQAGHQIALLIFTGFLPAVYWEKEMDWRNTGKKFDGILDHLEAMQRVEIGETSVMDVVDDLERKFKRYKGVTGFFVWNAMSGDKGITIVMRTKPQGRNGYESPYKIDIVSGKRGKFKVVVTAMQKVNVLEAIPEKLEAVIKGAIDFVGKLRKREMASLIATARELMAARHRPLPIRTHDMRKGTKFVMPNGTEFVVGEKIKDQFGTAIELINTKTKEKFTNDIEKTVKFLRRQKARFVIEDL